LEVEPNAVLAFAGRQLPSSSRFKGDLLARQEFHLLGGRGYLQASESGQTNAPSDLSIFVNQCTLDSPGFASVDLSLGLKRESWRVELFVHNLFDGRGEMGRGHECDPTICTRLYSVPMAPRLIGLTFGQSF
jgi:hypothetical protein